jgi:putative tryptophan/tyrosine transport system substrate-binding protein
MRVGSSLQGSVARRLWPLVARAQQQLTLPVIGFLSGGNSGALFEPLAAFRQGLGEQGYVEGGNVEFLYQFAEFHYDRLPALAAELVRRQVAVIVATSPGAASALAAKAATATIQIVFAIGIDPVNSVSLQA